MPVNADGSFRYRTDEHHNPDRQADFNFLRRERDRIGLPKKVTFGEFDANLNTGRIAAHCEWKCIDEGCYPAMDWHELKQKNVGQYLNYSNMCKMTEGVPMTIETLRDGKVHKQVVRLRAQCAVLVWHLDNTISSGSSIFDFCAVEDVAAYQVMYFKEGSDEPEYSPVVSGYGKPAAWQNFIMRFYGVTKDRSTGRLTCEHGNEAISLIDGKDLQQAPPYYYKDLVELPLDKLH